MKDGRGEITVSFGLEEDLAYDSFLSFKLKAYSGLPEEESPEVWWLLILAGPLV